MKKLIAKIVLVSMIAMFKYNPEGTRYGAIMNKISYAY